MLKKLLVSFIILAASYSFALTHFYDVNTIAKDSVLNDDLYIHSGAVVQCDPNYFRIFTVKGFIINEGTIRNDPVNGQYFYVYAEGDVNNNGTWGGRNLVLSGSSPQSISSGEFTPFEPTALISQNTSGIVAGSHVFVRNCTVNFNNNEMAISAGYDFNIQSGYITNAVLIGGNGAVLRGELEPYLENFTGIDLNLEGILNISSNVMFTGSTYNYAEIKNNGTSNCFPFVSGDFYNYGSLIDNISGYNYFYIMGNVYNDGIISCRNFILIGSSVQTVSCSDSTVFEPVSFISQNTSGITTGSDLYFKNCVIQASGSEIDLNGHTAFINSEYLKEIKISNGTLNMSAGAYLENTVLEDITLEGETVIGFNNDSYGELINNSVMMNDGSVRTFEIYGDLVNTAVMTTGTAGDLYVHAYGNITNSGTMDYYQTLVKGNTDQEIIVLDGAVIENTRFYLTSELETAPFEWQYNYAPIDLPNTSNETTFQMYFDNTVIGEEYFGTYFCETGAGKSRNIYIYNGTLPVPVITDGTYSSGTAEIQWENIPAAYSYKIYSSDDPYADPATWTYETEVFTNSCSLTDQSDAKKFYFVKAVY
ncbi:MAG: hypothetical protein JXN63_00180 [Candidatus Delongbacteria bacterium]|nr:hypothetical protein [Candidatus Delongbacteria bacterium]